MSNAHEIMRAYKEHEIIMALDASSNAVGWGECYCDGPTIMSVVGGLIRPKKRRAAAMDRIDSMVEQLLELLDERTEVQGPPSTIVVEIPSGKTHRRLKSKNPHGLAIYGMAVGAVRQACHQWDYGVEIVDVDANEWTGGGRKASRVKIALALAPSYAQLLSIDKGRDASDGICLAHWYARRRTTAA